MDKRSYLRESALILEMLPRFQKAVKEVRKKWNVHTDGYSRDDRAKAHAEMYWRADKDESKGDYDRFHDEIIPNTRMVRGSLRRLSKQFNLDYRWHVNLYFHILGGTKLDPPFENVNIKPVLNDVRLSQDKQIVRRLTIDIYQETTLADIRKAWKRVKEFQDMMPATIPSRKRTTSNVDRYIRIRQLEEEGKTHKQISEISELNFNGDQRAVSQLKREVESRFSPKLFKKIHTFAYR